MQTQLLSYPLPPSPLRYFSPLPTATIWWSFLLGDKLSRVDILLSTVCFPCLLITSQSLQENRTGSVWLAFAMWECETLARADLFEKPKWWPQWTLKTSVRKPKDSMLSSPVPVPQLPLLTNTSPVFLPICYPYIYPSYWKALFFFLVLFFLLFLFKPICPVDNSPSLFLP